MRVETGPVQFGDDWPGVFIRGDNAAWFAVHLRDLLTEADLDFAASLTLNDLADLLASCNVGNGPVKGLRLLPAPAAAAVRPVQEG
jgi:hypothetical protein